MSAKQTAENFWSRVDMGRGKLCWEWQGACNNTGYGTVAWAGKCYTAHRIAAWLSKIISDPSAPRDKKGNGFILHSCDNRKCCNPAHLSVGTYTDNQIDAYKKVRRAQPKGHLHVNAKLTSLQATAIREAYGKGQTQMKLAKIYNVSQRAISLVVRRETYK